MKADVLVFSVYNTCVKDGDVELIGRADIACVGASRILRTKIGSKALMQFGTTIPLYILLQKENSLF